MTPLKIQCRGENNIDDLELHVTDEDEVVVSVVTADAAASISLTRRQVLMLIGSLDGALMADEEGG